MCLDGKKNEIVWQVGLIEERTAVRGRGGPDFFKLNVSLGRTEHVFKHGLAYDLLKST